jgi:hypothetical protein
MNPDEATELFNELLNDACDPDKTKYAAATLARTEDLATKLETFSRHLRRCPPAGLTAEELDLIMEASIGLNELRWTCSLLNERMEELDLNRRQIWVLVDLCRDAPQDRAP